MRICAAQIRSITGKIEQNIERHKPFVATAVSHQADIIIFPELSLTNYEPTLAQALAIQPNDPRLDVFQEMADSGQIIIGTGAPTQNQPLPGISLIIFQPWQPRQMYTKQYLHKDERPYFVSGPRQTYLIGQENNAALAICYELSVAQHAEDAFHNGAAVYLSSVAKTARGVKNAHSRLAHIARQYAMTVLIANNIGQADGAECAGQSAVWNNEGELVGQLDENNEGILVFDTQTQELIRKMI